MKKVMIITALVLISCAEVKYEEPQYIGMVKQVYIIQDAWGAYAMTQGVCDSMSLALLGHHSIPL